MYFVLDFTEKYLKMACNEFVHLLSRKKDPSIVSVAQCGNVGNLPPIQKPFVKSIYSVTH